jgi:ribosomal protein S18 acetylase RimI-like enzyme
MDLTFANIHEDSAHGEHYYTLAAYEGLPDHENHSNIRGYIQYSDFQGEIYIKYIFVGKQYRRMGVATALMDELQKLYPDVEIDRGWATEEGNLFFEGYDSQHETDY